ncbi:HGxxPAAW family protein [Thermomonospora umbrina]|uniref:Uncharacterized protein n=1 Tax=Thermomonospora umbrina TaxID=111806 RepID=A0A3D9SS83_9ACTN|nr:HGxxPAAW family protein [Thermomonospora umbrina]REE98467.1 hypothetical protein DFJ69_3956 [Thermomonospora umbrina]
MPGSHGGQPKSWVSVVVTLVGFALGGIALCLGPNWFLFWAGAAIVMLGGLLGMAFGIFADVVLDEPRVLPEIVNYSLFGSRSNKRRGGRYGEMSELPRVSDPEHKPHG